MKTNQEYMTKLNVISVLANILVKPKKTMFVRMKEHKPVLKMSRKNMQRLIFLEYFPDILSKCNI